MNFELLLEAIYILDKYCIIENEEVKSILPENILTSMMRILAIYKLATYVNNKYYIKENHINKIEEYKTLIQEEVIPDEMKNILDKLKDKTFFKEITNLEYEIYSVANFDISFNIGQSLSNLIDFSNKSIIDIGGSSGGLATAIKNNYINSKVTVLDQSIPCSVGLEIKENNNTDIEFIEGDFFNIDLDNTYDYIILSNILHDYNNKDCISILNNVKKLISKNTKILIIEDILYNELEPVQVLERGLRLSINTIYGKQRTIEELNKLLKIISMNYNNYNNINDIQSVIIYQNIQPNKEVKNLENI